MSTAVISYTVQLMTALTTALLALLAYLYTSKKVVTTIIALPKLLLVCVFEPQPAVIDA